MSSDKEKEILKAALSHFVAAGFHGSATSRIAQDAGVANGTLFHYFKSKENLILQLYIQIKKELSAFIHEHPPVSDDKSAYCKHVFIHALRWALKEPIAFRYIQLVHHSPYQAQVPPEALEMQHRKDVEILQQAMDTGLIRKMPLPLLLTLVNSHLFGLFEYLQSGNFSPREQEKVMTEGFNLLWDMLTENPS